MLRCSQCRVPAEVARLSNGFVVACGVVWSSCGVWFNARTAVCSSNDAVRLRSVGVAGAVMRLPGAACFVVGIVVVPMALQYVCGMMVWLAVKDCRPAMHAQVPAMS